MLASVLQSRAGRLLEGLNIMSATGGAAEHDPQALHRAWADYWRAYAADREIAFGAARRHSARVRWLKRAIVFGSLGIIGALAALSLINPFGALPGGFAIDRATLSGTRVTMDQPRMNGFRKDGRPYNVRARTGVQNVRNPGVIELNEIEARIEAGDNNTVNVIAPEGVFDSAADRLQLKAPASAGFITIKSTSGFDIRLRSADMNVKSGEMTSNDPVAVRMNNGTIDASRMEVRDSGKVIVFTGNVRSLIRPGGDAGEEDDTAPQAEGDRQQ